MAAKKILLLGAGHVGSLIAYDLKLNGHEVSAVDIDKEALLNLSQKGIHTYHDDFTDSSVLQERIKDMDLIVGATPGNLGFEIMKNVLEKGKNMVDISFCPEDYMELDSLAKKNNCTLIPDIGVAPGMCNVILGHHNAGMKVNSYKCLVGGLPLKREWPLEYKASWSPADVIEEYSRPARLKENGRIISKPALSDVELVNIDPVGSLEEFNSDGLRSLLFTMTEIPNMVEKTLRYPGTVEYLKVLKHLGYFSNEEVIIGGKKLKPAELSVKLLEKNWKRKKGEKEFTLMRVIINGMEQDKKVEYSYDLYDEYDEETDTLSMARTTGYTCVAAAELIMEGFNEKGVIPPEYLGKSEKNYEFIFNYLKKKKIINKLTKKDL